MPTKSGELKQDHTSERVVEVTDSKPEISPVTNNKHEMQVKEEVVSAYNEVLRKLTIVKDNATPEERMEAMEEEEVVLENIRIIDGFMQESPEELVKNITDLKVFVSKELKMLEEKLLPYYERFHNLRRAIDFSEKELKEHHHIKTNINTLTALITAHKEKMAAFEDERAAYKKQFEEEKALSKKNRMQEEEEYLLKRNAKRKLEQQQYEVKRHDLDRELSTRRAAFEEEASTREARLVARENEHQQLKEREARIIAREQEYDELKTQVQTFPEELRTAVERVERSITDQLTRKYGYEVKLAQIELESERKLYQQKLSALTEQIEQYKMLKQQFTQEPSFAENEAVDE